jgi:hypothetical protein
MTQSDDNQEIEIGDIVLVDMTFYSRVIQVEYFGQKDGRSTFGGPVLASTDKDKYIPEQGWFYTDQAIPIEKCKSPPKHRPEMDLD